MPTKPLTTMGTTGFATRANGCFTSMALVSVFTLACIACQPCSRESLDPSGDSLPPRSFSLLQQFDSAQARGHQGWQAEVALATIGGVPRPAILAPASTTIQFPTLTVPRNARLAFGVGLTWAREGSLTPTVFAIRVMEGTEPGELLWSEQVDPPWNPGAHKWQDVSLDLSHLEGRRVQLAFSSEPVEEIGTTVPVWSSPVIESRGRIPHRLEQQIERRVVVAETAISPDGARLQVPDHSSLEVGAQILWQGAPPVEEDLSPVDFELSIDGETMVRRQLSLPGWPFPKHDSFRALLPLHQFAGKSIDITASTTAQTSTLSERIQTRWLPAKIVETRKTTRRTRDGGPNVLLVVVDTLRADHLSLYGYGRPTSPHLDNLAGSSVVFSHAVSQSSWTMPSTATILTGLYPEEHGVSGEIGLSATISRLPEALQAQGFTTFGLSTNPVVGPDQGFQQGFEVFLHLPWARAELVNQELLHFLDEFQDVRWFAYLHFIDAHDPYGPPRFRESFTGSYDGPARDRSIFTSMVEKTNFGRGDVEFEQSDVDYFRDLYDAEILYWDWAFQRLLEDLETRDSLSNTVIIVTGDHGEEFLEHGALKHGLHLYGESTGVPLVIHAPGVLRPRVIEEPVEVRGIFDFCQRLGNLPSPVDETWLLEPLLHGGPVYSKTSHAQTSSGTPRMLASVEDSEWKYIAAFRSDEAELFNIKNDPGEQQNLVKEHPELAAHYRGLLLRWLETTRQRRQGLNASPDRKTESMLRELGYIQ